jgi:hypothetical protein
MNSRATHYKHMIGQNVTFLKVPSFTVATICALRLVGHGAVHC